MSDPPERAGQDPAISTSPLDPLAVVGADDVGDQVVAILEQLRERARGLRDYADELLQRVEGMRDLVLSLSSEGLARRELEERLAVLEAERDVLARQLGKVRRENEEELAIARERVKGLETELSLATQGGIAARPERAEDSEAREAGADIEQPVVETLAAKARREALKTRSQRGRPKSRPPRFPKVEDEGGSWTGARPDEAEVISFSGAADFSGLLDEAPPAKAQPAGEAGPFLGLLDSPWDAAPEEPDTEKTPVPGSDMPELPDGLLELEEEPTQGFVRLEEEPTQGFVRLDEAAAPETEGEAATTRPGSLETLLSSYLKEK